MRLLNIILVIFTILTNEIKADKIDETLINLKKGGIVCRGQGMAKNKKITKMY